MVKASCKKLTWMPLLFMECIEAKKRAASPMELAALFCTPLGIRTLDPLIKSQLLYQLS